MERQLFAGAQLRHGRKVSADDGCNFGIPAGGLVVSQHHNGLPVGRYLHRTRHNAVRYNVRPIHSLDLRPLQFAGHAVTVCCQSIYPVYKCGLPHCGKGIGLGAGHRTEQRQLLPAQKAPRPCGGARRAQRAVCPFGADLAAQGLKTDFVHLENGMTRINVKIKAGQETELNGAGPAIPESALQQLEAQLDKLAEGDILILAGSIPASLPQSVYERLLARLQGRGVRAVVDATRDLLVNVLPYHPFLIKPNNHELGEIVGKVLTSDAEIVAAARTLQEKGARNVLVSMAGDGALLLDEQGQVHRIGCPKGKVVNSVGAGDSMVAGFVAGYLQSRSYAQALRLGTACGSATAFSLGLATKEKIDELLAQL